MRTDTKNNGFIYRELHPPFVVEKDSDYLPNLKRKYDTMLRLVENAGAGDCCLAEIWIYRNKILKALYSYYSADITRSYEIVRNLVAEVYTDSIAVAKINKSRAFSGKKAQELQFFRARTGNPSEAYSAKEMLHLPKSLRSKAGSYRFSIPGNPSYYLANSSYGCWLETGYPAEIDFNVSPVLLDGSQKIFNLVMDVSDFYHLDFSDKHARCWLKLFMLMIATSYRINEADRAFKSEYIIPQAIMMACKKSGLDGVAYYSRRVADDAFARCAINLALFVDYQKEYSPVVKHMKIDNPVNYALYKQLSPSSKYKDYDLSAVKRSEITNIGSYSDQHPYIETEFYEFDKYLFATWAARGGGKGKDDLPWGVNVDE